MTVKVFDSQPVREVPIEDICLSEYMTVKAAAAETGLDTQTIYSNIHQSRLIGSVLVGTSRLVKRDDVLALAKSLKSEACDAAA
jgi:excisionase family DNA binding protein